MKLRWSREANNDLARLHEFMVPLNSSAADRLVVRLIKAPERLLDLPRMGSRLESFEHREVRRLLADAYEIQYELLGAEITILRVFHVRENR